MTECVETRSRPTATTGNLTMQAVQLAQSGAPKVLRMVSVDQPRIDLGSEVKVRLHAAGVNPIDAKLRKRGLYFPEGLPAILGCDGAGIIEDVGIAVSRFKPGDGVWFCHGGLGREPGAYAQYSVIDESIVRHKPASMDFVEAAASPLVLITAWEALFDRAGLQAGQTVLIHGAAGGVGHVAVQLARLKGARVLVTVSTEAKAAFVRALGADEIIRYDEVNFVDAVYSHTSGHGVDVALDTVGGKVFRDTMHAMAHYGHLVTLLDPGTDLVFKELRNRNVSVSFELMLTPMIHDLPEQRLHQGEILDQCAAWIDEGKLKIRLSQTFPYAQAAHAHELIEAGHMQGKIVLTID